jgi:WD40 repeat protein/serine/threonine protein kinase
VNPKNAPLEAWTPAQYARISQLLDDALGLVPEAREGWLADLETRDRDAAQEIRELLKPGEDRIERILTGADEVIASLPEADWSLVGRHFGPYRVCSLLGHGGMGSVWLAERVDGLLERRVALKLVHPALIGLGFAERLVRERAILASLDHPNVARLFDAGLSEDSQPYLALEYVPGTSFVTYCDQHRLSVPERLELFRQALNAVQYAHAHLVIHRDLKPSNILVTEQGRVCLLDFGIAKLLTEGVAKETELTQLGGRPLSPRYAAPEQITGAPITIAADIYALGVMLHELLTAEGPYRLTRPSRGALEEAILAAEIVPPSRVAVSAAAAEARAATPQSLSRLLRGDLDTIVAKALGKSPTERYATADALEEDIVHWLRSEPVRARRQSLAYRAAKFARRHWLGVAVAAAFLLAIAAGLAATTYEARVATLQRDAALQAQLRSLTQSAAARLRDDDTAGALAIILEVLRQQGTSRRDVADALAVFHEARAADLQILAFGGRTGSDISSVDFSPDGQRVVTVSSDGAARIWDAATGYELMALKAPAEQILSAKFSPGGERILTGLASSNDLRIWSAATGRPLLEFEGHTDQVWGTAFSPNGRRVVSASWDKTARVWDATTGLELLRLHHDDKVFDAQFSPDGRRVITGAHDLIARIWDASTGRKILELVGHKEAVNVATYSPDGREVLTVSAETARLWDAATGRLRLPLTGHSGQITEAHFSRDGRRIVTASEDRTARIWDAMYGRQTAVLAHPVGLWSAAFSPDGRYVATTGADRSSRLWDVSIEPHSVLTIGHPEQVAAAAFSPDGGRILTASYDRTAAVWDARTGQLLTTLRGHTDRVWAAAFSPDGRRIVTGSRDYSARVWDGATGRELLELRGHTGGIRCAAFSPDGRRIVTASYDHTARIWDATAGRELLRLLGHTGEVQCAAFSPDSRRVATASNDGTGRIWDAATGRELLHLAGHTSYVLSAVFSPDGQRVLTASDDATARIWNASTGRELAQLRGHKSGVADAEFSPDGRRIVTGSQDRTVRVWDAATAREIMLYRAHDDEIESATFSPDGSRIVSASLDGTARVWDARIPTLEQQLVWAEAAQFDPLSRSERFAFGLPAATELRQRPKSHQPDALARQGAAADEAAFLARTAADRDAHFLAAFRYFAEAAACAETEGWPDEAWSGWRYRRASLARLLARAGMMAEVADAYTRIRLQNAPPPPTMRERLAAWIGAR